MQWADDPFAMLDKGSRARLNEFMKTLFSLLLLSVSSVASAVDCGSMTPFSGGDFRVRVTVARQIGTDLKDLCSKSTTVRWFDVRGREEEAYWCLKPLPSEVLECETSLAGDPAVLHVLPASWVRRGSLGDLREFRFHAYVQKKTDPGFYVDIFSRGLTFDLWPKPMIIEGSLRDGPANPGAGHWVRVEFELE